MKYQNQHSVFINHQKKLDKQIQRLIDRYYPDVGFQVVSQLTESLLRIRPGLVSLVVVWAYRAAIHRGY